MQVVQQFYENASFFPRYDITLPRYIVTTQRVEEGESRDNVVHMNSSTSADVNSFGTTDANLDDLRNASYLQDIEHSGYYSDTTAAIATSTEILIGQSTAFQTSNESGLDVLGLATGKADMQAQSDYYIGTTLETSHWTPNATRDVLDTSFIRTLGITIGIFDIIVGSIGNLLTIIAILCNRKLQTTFHMFIANLCVIDFLTASTMMPFNVTSYATETWPFGENSFSCKFMAFSYYCCGYSSIVCLLTITVNRFVGIVYPEAYDVVFTKPRIMITIAISWMFAPTFLAPIFFFSGGGYGWIPKLTLCVFNTSNYNEQQKHYMQFIRVLFQFLPLLVMIVLYTKIFRTSRQSRLAVTKISMKSDSEMRVRTYSKSRTSHSPMLMKLFDSCKSTPVARRRSGNNYENHMPAQFIRMEKVPTQVPARTHDSVKNLNRSQESVVEQEEASNHASTNPDEESDVSIALGKSSCESLDHAHDCDVINTPIETGEMPEPQSILAKGVAPPQVTALSQANSYFLNSDSQWHSVNFKDVSNQPASSQKSPGFPPEIHVINAGGRSVSAPSSPIFSVRHYAGPGSNSALDKNHNNSTQRCNNHTNGRRSPQGRQQSASPALQRASRQSRKLSRYHSAMELEAKKRKLVDQRLLRISVTICIAFMVLFLPSVIVNLLPGAYKIDPRVHMFASIVTWLNSCVNPVIYCFMNAKMREQYKLLLAKACNAICRCLRIDERHHVSRQRSYFHTSSVYSHRSISR